jgi:hypothetical protein
MVGHHNAKNEKRLVEDIVGDLAKTMDGLANLCLKFDK